MFKKLNKAMCVMGSIFTLLLITWAISCYTFEPPNEEEYQKWKIERGVYHE